MTAEPLQVRVVKSTEDDMQLDIEGVDVSMVNALRRILLSEIPNVAFDPEHINIIRNTCSLHNEFLAHRLGLIPICMDADEIDRFENPTSYKFVIDVKNNTNAMMTVTTEHIKILDANGNAMAARFHEKVFPKNKITGDRIIITRLKPNPSDPKNGDELFLEAHASKGVAKSNASWCPVSLCTYFNIIDDSLVASAFAEYAQKHSNLGLKEDELRKRFDALEVQRCFKKNAMEEPNAFTFKLQSECRMTPAHMFIKAIDVLDAMVAGAVGKLDEFACENANGMDVVVMPGYDHTLGNFLQASLYNLHVRGGRLTYVGYFQPHPLENNIVLKLKLQEGGKVREFLRGALEDVRGYIAGFREVCTGALSR